MQNAGMLSPTGRCRPFDNDADGIVVGNGVGIVVLKRLADAERDGDQIYGVIRATGTNQDGKTSGITVPSFLSQSKLVESIYRRQGIDAESIQYIEAHGTATKLGDPIEIHALTHAFERFTAKKRFCGIGSVKANIGHTGPAAGVLSLIKVCLSMKHGQVPPSINFKQENRHIDFANSPVYVNTELKPWPVNASGSRIAAISSFGFSGTNAHLVLEQYVEELEIEQGSSAGQQPALIVLSAKSEGQLKERVQQLLAHLQQCPCTERDLAAIAYTLQVGRDAMEFRLAFAAATLEEAKHKLAAYLGRTSTGAAENIHVGDTSTGKETLSIFEQDAAFQHTIDTWIAQRQHTKLLQLWAKGLGVEWTRLYRENTRPGRTSLPTYPFTRRRYDIEGAAVKPQENALHGVLHPLLQRNTSDLNEQRFSSTFSGHEFYSSNLLVMGAKRLPDTCLLEMAREAVDQSVGPARETGRGIVLRDVEWLRPVPVDSQSEVHIGLQTLDDDSIGFEVFSAAQVSVETDADRVIHVEGRAVLTAALDASTKDVDLASLSAGCHASLDVAECYARLRAAGMEYGPALRGLSALRIGEAADEPPLVLAEVTLPGSVSDTQNRYVLHPTVLEAVLQAANIGALVDAENRAGNMLPLCLGPSSLHEIAIHDRVPAQSWIIVRPSPHSRDVQAGAFDAHIYNAAGQPCVRMSGFTTRRLNAAGQGNIAQLEDAKRPWLLRASKWQAKPCLKSKSPQRDGHWVWLDASYARCVDELRAQRPHIAWEVLPVWSAGQGYAAQQLFSAATQLFSGVQKILQAKPKTPVLVQMLLSSSADTDAYGWPLAGLLKSAQLENSQFSGQVIELTAAATAHEILTAVEAEAATADREIRYRTDTREVLMLEDVGRIDRVHPVALPWKSGGVYLVTGGALGLSLAGEIAKHASGVRIVVIGGSSLGRVRRAQIAELMQRSPGTTIDYCVLDPNNEAALAACVHGSIQKYGTLNGVINLAGVAHESFIVKKSVDEFRAVLEPIVCTTIQLDEATRELPLDFFILFASSAGAFGNAGRSDWALGNAFLDRYATYRNDLVGCGKRQGRTLSLGWPVDDEPVERLLFAEQWQNADDATSPVTVEPPRTIAVLLNDSERRRAVQEAIDKQGFASRLVFIAQVEGTAQVPAADESASSVPTFCIDRQSAASYARVLGDVREKCGSLDALWYLWPLEDAGCLSDQMPITYLLQGLASAGIASARVLLVAEHNTPLTRCYVESWIGYERSIKAVLPNVEVALLHTAAQSAPDAGGSASTMAPWAARLMSETRAEKLESAFYVDGRRQVLRTRPLRAAVADSPSALRKHGTYLITGGMGGLGHALAQYLAEHYSANLILTGRSGLDVAKERSIATFERNGARVMYVAADAADAGAMNIALKLGCERFGDLHGVFHAAGVESGANLLACDLETMERVSSPKIRATVVLAELLRDRHVDFVAYFSSISAVIGDFGSCHYAVGNRFQLSYAKYANPKAIALCWPLWKGGGMGRGDVEAVTGYLQATGQQALSIEDGLEVLETLLCEHASNGLGHGITMVSQRSRAYRALGVKASPPGHDFAEPSLPSVPVATWSGTAELTQQEKLAAFHDAWAVDVEQVLVTRSAVAMAKTPVMPRMPIDSAPKTAAPASAPIALALHDASSDTSRLVDRVRSALIQVISQLLKLRAEEVYAEAEFSDFGFDSISFMAFATELNRNYGLDLSPTIFFEHPTVRQLAEYLMAKHRSLLEVKFEVRLSAPARSGSDASADARVESNHQAVSMAPRRRQRAGSRANVQSTRRTVVEPTAIIGMSARFPGASDLEQFWDVLSAGQSTITEIPRERWDWQAFYGDPSREANKTDIKWGGFIDGIAEFDPLFFNISPGEAESMDPQQRLLMMHCWKAIEDAGYSAHSLSGSKTGIFVGMTNADYSALVAAAKMTIEGYSSTGVVTSMGPNRMSFHLNFHGPSEPIDTACSSALVAVHRAVRAMQSGDCDMALAGGVNTIITPWAHISFSKAGMLSVDGRCKTFAKDANGYVRGEGIGILFLKKLSLAESDGDHIYGLIRGSSENHGGRANSLTAPNPKAQAEMIKAAYREAAIDPRTVTYIETHGTGTPLGDPIEIDGLKNAFTDLFAEHPESEFEGRCGLGSVKTNIGHLELAAGVAGIIKVLLQMKHKTLVKSLHAEEINPFIHIEGSPFFIVREAAPWESLVGRDGNMVPKRAGVSSFGFGGVNAHVILEEYRGPQASGPIRFSADRPALIVLSAKNAERLDDQARQLLSHLIDQEYREDDLASIAYTLQVGREAMESRLAFTAASIAQLQDKLRSYLEGKCQRGEIEECYRGDLKKNKDALSSLNADEDTDRLIRAWLEKGKYAKLLELWVKGLAFDWSRLYGASAGYSALRPTRVSLPTYPFAKDRYWVDATSSVPSRNPGVVALHPLLQRNTSDLRMQRFTSTFAGDEFFLRDHTVQGRPILPGVCYLEMAREAVARGAGLGGGEGRGVSLEDVVWIQPVVLDDSAVDIHIGLSETQHGAIEFEIYSLQQENGDATVHAQGRALLVGMTDAVERMDIAALQRQSLRVLGAQECYAMFSSVGIDYGAAHQGLASIQLGQDPSGQQFVLAQVKLPACVSETQDRYVLHPSVLDSALQASIGFVIAAVQASEATAGSPALPFALEYLEIFDRTPAISWVVVRASEDTAAGDQPRAMQKWDVTVCDDAGRVCVRISALSSRVLDGELNVRLTGQMSSSSGASLAANAATTDVTTPPPYLVDQAQPASQPMAEGELRAKTTQFLKKAVSGILKMPADRIDADTGLESYGIDSILALRLVSTLEGYFGSLRKTLMFEHQTIDALAAYFIEHHRESLLPHLDLKPKQLAASVSQPARVDTRGIRGVATLSASSTRPGGTSAATVRTVDIAVIGMSGRYPQANDVNEFWANLSTGRDCITEIPPTRWDHSRYFDPEKGKLGKSSSKWGGFIEGVDEFDPLFFNISPREAVGMDPQERLFLQCAYLTLEDAGYTREALKRLDAKVGVFVGVMYEEYQLYGAQAQLLGHAYALGGSPASIANRVSYFCGFRGPSMAVDTMCSSSLTAVHLACESINRGSCDSAIAGGVNVSVHVNKYLMLSQGQFFSSSGRCESFGKDGDGFVPGEGVGAVFLKPLPQAIADRDQIYGVIKGTSVNHGGKTNGYTVPNPNAQAEVIAAALKNARVNARTISYIEAHGTGTSLGDPIEITGLTQVFEKDTDEKQYCAIGSAKSNIGHLESAAGIAALTKVLLQMKHGALVPSLHAAVLNPHIEFERTPFRVQREFQGWQRPLLTIDGRSTECPRIAGVSSFGAGGANAHVIVEEYRTPASSEGDAARFDETRPALIVLSAKSESQLRERATQLLAYVANTRGEESLVDLAYTLQVGRDAMEQRLAFTAVSMQELKNKLSAYVGDAESEELYRGTGKPGRGMLSRFSADEDSAVLIQSWLEKGKYGALLELWAGGLSFDWTQLYANGSPYADIEPGRISLPGYPFARERYWIPSLLAAQGNAETSLHPLLQRNTSELGEQRFSSTFLGEEFFFRDHVVAGHKVLPGVVYLEMALQAATRSAGFECGAGTRATLKDVTWIRPVIVENSPEQVHIGLWETDDEEIQFEVYSLAAAGDMTSDPVVHAQGRVVLEHPITGDTEERLDLAALAQQCDLAIEVSDLYGQFSALGVEYGPAHRGLVTAFTGMDASGQRRVLAHVKLPACVSDTQRAYFLHPSTMDSALQASLALWLREDDEPKHDGRSSKYKGALPYAVESVQVAGVLPTETWVVLTQHAMPNASSSVQKIDVVLCDASGRVCVKVSGLVLRAMQHTRPALAAAASIGAQDGELALLLPRWEAVVPPFVTAGMASTSKALLIDGTAEDLQLWNSVASAVDQLTVDADAPIEELAQRIAESGKVQHLVWVAPRGMRRELAAESILVEQELGVIRLFRIAKALLSLEYGAERIGLTVVTWQTQEVELGESFDATHASIHGLVGSLTKELSDWTVRLVDLPREFSGACLQRCLNDVLRLQVDASGNAWAYRHGEWYRQQLVMCSAAEPQPPVYRHQGVYVVIGGAGGIGEAFTEFLINRYQAQVVWIGRRALDDEIRSKIERLATLGPAPTYVQADATDLESLTNAHRQIRECHPAVHGLVHAAIVLLDKSIRQMDEQRFKASLHAKVDVSVRMVQAFAQEKLDFVLFFSSLQSFTKAAGQSNYAAGCTFKDAFARQLNQDWACPVKVMNWGYWGSVGIVASAAYRERLAMQGIASIEPGEAMAALEYLLRSSSTQVALLKVTQRQLLTAMGVVPERTVLAAAQLPSLRGRISERSNRVPAISAMDNEDLETFVALESVLIRLLYAQLQSLGLFVNDRVSVSDWRNETRVPAMYARWLHETVRILEEHGYVTADGEMLRVSRPELSDLVAIWTEWERHKRRLKVASLSTHLDLAEATLRQLPDILRGTQRATDILFPNSSVAFVSGVYKHNPIADYFNAVLTDALVEFVAARLKDDPNARIRILEIGAGTGGTSEEIFRGLKPYERSIAEYCYTDISRAFLLHAEEAYRPVAPYLRTRLLNVEQSLQSQSVDIGSYDVVVATNVLHATKNIRRTLRNAKGALKCHGMLLLNEIATHSLFTHLTFGLLEGWWLYEDVALRIPGTPAVSPESWRRALVGEGFQSILFPASAAHELGQQIIIAESDGLLTQPENLAEQYSLPVLERVLASPAPSSREPETTAPQRSERFAPAGGADDARTCAHVRARAIGLLTALVSDALKVPQHQLDADTPLPNYGLDSILVVTLTNALRQFVSGVTATLFIEHESISELIDQLLKTDRDAIERWTGAHARTFSQARSFEQERKQATSKGQTEIRGDSSSSRRRRRPAVSSTTHREAAATANGSIAHPEIAIIGVSGRYPGADNIGEFWENLKAGKDCIEEIPPSRWDYREYFHPEKGKPGKTSCKWGGFINGIDSFDYSFFDISKEDAESMDRQERLFLEAVWHLFEDAGYTQQHIQHRHHGSVGVYVGARSFVDSGISTGFMASRVANFLKLNGPTLVVDTFSASSITAVHLACGALARGDCELAIAGGANILDSTIYVGAAIMLSTQESRRGFSTGDGIILSEGVGAVLLKPLATAVRHNDRILAVIKATAVGNGGRDTTRAAMNPKIVASVIKTSLARAEVHPRTIGCVEAFATGVPTNDYVEVLGYKSVFTEQTTDRGFCALGTVKSSIGHAIAVSGLSQLTKALLQIRHGQLVPTIKTEPLNPDLDFTDGPFYLQTSLREWTRFRDQNDPDGRELPRRAIVTSMGADATVLCVVLEEYPLDQARPPQSQADSPIDVLLIFSARTLDQLRDMAARMRTYVASNPNVNLSDMAYTLNMRREAMQHRLAIVVRSAEEVVSSLNEYLESPRVHGAKASASRSRIFTGESAAGLATLRELIDESQEKELLKLHIEQNNLEKIAKFWVLGSSIQADDLGWSTQGRLLSLPLYPFAESHVESIRDALRSNPQDTADAGSFSMERTV
jgi:acyl transferase domain-containing protein/acyl carrier protein/SAM-dependent methyltransferase